MPQHFVNKHQDINFWAKNKLKMIDGRHDVASCFLSLKAGHFKAWCSKSKLLLLLDLMQIIYDAAFFSRSSEYEWAAF